MKIASSKTRDQFPLSRKKILKKILGKALGSLFMVIFFAVIFGTFISGLSQTPSIKLSVLIASIVAAVIIILVLIYFYESWYFAVYFYDFTEDHVVIRKGPITPREITVPYERIQDVYIDQDILDRTLGIYDMHLSTATAMSGMEAHIDGVPEGAAQGLKAALLKKMSDKMKSEKGKDHSGL